MHYFIRLFEGIIENIQIVENFFTTLDCTFVLCWMTSDRTYKKYQLQLIICISKTCSHICFVVSRMIEDTPKELSNIHFKYFSVVAI